MGNFRTIAYPRTSRYFGFINDEQDEAFVYDSEGDEPCVFVGSPEDCEAWVETALGEVDELTS